MRIWYQGLIPRSKSTEAYYSAMEEHAAVIGGKDTEVVFHGIPTDTYPAGFGPAEFTRYIAGEFVEIHSFARMVTRAEEEGFDAVIIGTLQEPGLSMLRTLTDIPIIGYGQAASLIGRYLGDRIGVLAFNEALFPIFKERLNLHVPGCVEQVVGLQVSYEELHKVFEGEQSDNLAAAIRNGCDELVAGGVSVIVPGQMLLTEAARVLGVSRVSQVPVMDGLGTLVAFAKSLVVLRQVSGMTINRRGFSWARALPEIREALVVL